MTFPPLFLLLLFCSPWFSFVSSLSLPSSISSHMVLQRAPQSSQLWGTATPLSQVSVLINDNDLDVYITQTNSEGEWLIQLDPHPAGVGYEITIIEKDPTLKLIQSETLLDVAFGDVYICSGQSNMEFTVSSSFTAQEAIATAGSHPHLRLLDVSDTLSLTPMTNFSSTFPENLRWVRSDPAIVGGPEWNYFSAVCFYFGRELQTGLLSATQTLIPLGLISSNWGGTNIQAWSSPQCLSRCPEPSGSLDSPDPNLHPSSLWNGMIHPFLPMSIAGAVWYQGEANFNQPEWYSCQFPAMITDWRSSFPSSSSNFPFYFVQVSSFMEAGGTYAALRQAQMAALSLPRVYAVESLDLGDRTSPWGDIHPRNKLDVGKRLAAVAMRNEYGVNNIVAAGPVLDSVLLPHPRSYPVATAAISLILDSQSTGTPILQLKGTESCVHCCSTDFLPFEFVLNDGSIVRASGVQLLTNDSIVLVSVDLQKAQKDKGVEVVSLRYDWEDAPECALYGAEGLPVFPFEFSKTRAIEQSKRGPNRFIE